MCMSKKCKECFLVKELTEFYDSKRTRDQKEGKCKACRLEYNALWQKHNPLKCQAKTIRYRIKKKANQSSPS